MNFIKPNKSQRTKKWLVTAQRVRGEATARRKSLCANKHFSRPSPSQPHRFAFLCNFITFTIFFTSSLVFYAAFMIPTVRSFRCLNLFFTSADRINGASCAKRCWRENIAKQNDRRRGSNQCGKEENICKYNRTTNSKHFDSHENYTLRLAFN